MDINVAHMFYHLGEKLLNVTLNKLGIKLADILKACDRDIWTPTKLGIVWDKVRKPIPVKWIFKSTLEPDGSKCLKLHVNSKSFMQVPSIDFTEKFNSVATNMSTVPGSS